MDRLRVLDLFSGTGSVAKVCQERADEFECYSLDVCDKYHKPTVQTDIMAWDYTQFPPGHFDIIMASPPCKAYAKSRTTLHSLY